MKALRYERVKGVLLTKMLAITMIAGIAVLGFVLEVSPPVASAFSVSLLSDNPGKTLTDITTDGTNLYINGAVGTSSAIFGASISGGAATQLYSAWNPAGVAVIGSNIYWIDPNAAPPPSGGTAVFKAPNSGAGPVTTLAYGYPGADGSDIATDGTLLYTSDYVGGRVFSLNPINGSSSMLAQLYSPAGFYNEHKNYLAYGDNYLFLADTGYSGYAAPGIYKVSKTGGGFSSLYTGGPFNYGQGNDGIKGIAYGDGSLYVTQGNTIYWISENGGLLNSFTSPLFTQIAGLTYDDGFLYILDNAGGSGKIWEVDTNPVPEPATMLLLGSGLVGLAGFRRRFGKR